MSILSSRLTGEFMRAAAAAARTSQSASLPGPGTSFRDQFEAARTARTERRESAGAAGGPDRDRDRADATGTTRTGGGSEDTEPSEDVDELVEIDAAATEAGPSNGPAASVAGVRTIDPVIDDGSASLEGGPVIDASASGGVFVETTGEGVDPQLQAWDDASTGRPMGIAGPTEAAGDASAAVAVDASGDPAVAAPGGSARETIATDPVGQPAPDSRIADRATSTGIGPVDAAAAGRAEATSAAAPKPGNAAISDPRARAEIAPTDPTTTGGRVEVQDAAPRAEQRIEPSAYRSAMADRAAGRDLSPAERQAMSLDERIATARAAAAAGRLGISGAAAGSSAAPAAAASGVRAGGRPFAAAATAMTGAPDASAVRPAGSAAGSASSTPANTAPAPMPTITVDAGVPARPANAGSAAGVDAASMPGRPGGGEDAVAQALRGARMLIGRNGGSMTMRLQPGDLGELRVRMEIRGGRVSADFQATSEVARERLEQGLEVLRRGLEERGLQVERLTVRAAETESARPNAESGRSARDGEPSGRGGDAAGSEGRRDDAADGESRGRREDAPSRRPFADRASSPDALRAFASIFGDRTR